MADKEPTKAEQLKRELAVELKNEILEKIKPETLYRSGDNRKFFRLQDNGNATLVAVDTNKVYDPDLGYKLGELLATHIKVSQIALYSGCWGMTDCPVKTVRKSSKKELQQYFNKLADKVCDLVRINMNDIYESVAGEMDLLHRLEHDEWDK